MCIVRARVWRGVTRWPQELCDIVSVISITSAETHNLRVGSKTYAVIKASNVMVAVDG